MTIKNMFIVVVALAFFSVVATTAFANPFYSGSQASFSTATSTQFFLRPGVATSSSVIYDSYEASGTNQSNTGNLTLPNSVALLLEGNASSTATTITATCEFSDNYNASTGNGDWYQNEIGIATTSNPVNILVPTSFVFTYASTTVGGAAVGNATRFQKLVECPVPLRYVRAVITVSGANASVNPIFVPKKQRN